MCGSGTLAIEAAGSPSERPRTFENNFGLCISRVTGGGLEGTPQKARTQSKKTPSGKIVATDMRPEAVQAAKQNAMTAGVEHLVEFGVCDYSETPVPEPGGVIVLNPPYGERLGDRKQLEGLYQGIGDFFKKKCQGYRGYVFTGNLDLSKKVGLRTKRRLPFYNGEIECRLLEYELYEGSKKSKRT
jgi:putative N6-adenine-specific DNA methylase